MKLSQISQKANRIIKIIIVIKNILDEKCKEEKNPIIIIIIISSTEIKIGMLLENFIRTEKIANEIPFQLSI